jgi:hypothetical protein
VHHTEILARQDTAVQRTGIAVQQPLIVELDVRLHLGFVAERVYEILLLVLASTNWQRGQFSRSHGLVMFQIYYDFSDFHSGGILL